MKNMILATRYARALYSLSHEAGVDESVFAQMRAIEQVLESEVSIEEFFRSAVVQPAEKLKAMQALCEKVKIAEPFKNFLLVLAKKNRVSIFREILTAFQIIADEAHGVTRGTVRSAGVLDPQARQRIETLVSQATKKQVILSYKEDPSLLGGLVAEVGSYTFDDSLTSHLTRINEQLTRSAH